MVTYLPSSAQRAITVTAIVTEVGTTLTINAPAEVDPGALFYVYGLLTRNDSGSAIPGAIVNISYNGTHLGSATTSIDGIYEINVAIPVSGTFTLTAGFAGMTVAGLTFWASSAYTRIGLGEPSMLPLVAVLAVAAYVVMKK